MGLHLDMRGDMTWSKITLPNAQDVHIRAYRLQSQFEGIFLTALGPKEAAMFQDHDMEHGCNFYFSPKATEIFSQFLRGIGLSLTPCAAPAKDSVSLLVGHADAREMLS